MLVEEVGFAPSSLAMDCAVRQPYSFAAVPLSRDCINAVYRDPPLTGRRTYSRSVSGNNLEDYGLIWMARSPSGSRQLLMAGLTSAGTGGVSEFFCDPDRMRPVYEQLRAASKNRSIVPEWQVLLHIHARENVPLQIDFISLRASGVER